MKRQQLVDNNRQIITWSIYSHCREEPLTIACKKSIDGMTLLQQVCNSLLIEDEIDCLGLKYIDSRQQKFWIDKGKPLSRQYKHSNNTFLSLEYQCYPVSLDLVTSFTARTLLFRQLCYDINQGHLKLDNSDYCNELAALALQVYRSTSNCLLDENEEDIFSNHKLKMALDTIFPDQNTFRIEEVERILWDIRSLDVDEAERRFISILQTFRTYGVRTIPAKDKHGNSFGYGFNHLGIHLFNRGETQAHEGLIRYQLFEWSCVTKLTSRGSDLHMNVKKSGLRKISLTFESSRLAKETWKYSLVQQAFFMFNRGVDVPIRYSCSNIFKRSKFNYNGRSQNELITLASTKASPICSSKESTLTTSLTLSGNDYAVNVPLTGDASPKERGVQGNPGDEFQDKSNNLAQTKQDERRNMLSSTTEDLVKAETKCNRNVIRDVTKNENEMVTVVPVFSTKPNPCEESDSLLKTKSFRLNEMDIVPDSQCDLKVNHKVADREVSAILRRTNPASVIASETAILGCTEKFSADKNAQQYVRTVLGIASTIFVIWILLNSIYEWKKQILRFF